MKQIIPTQRNGHDCGVFVCMVSILASYFPVASYYYTKSSVCKISSPWQAIFFFTSKCDMQKIFVD